jgi:hypothetical protein
MLPSEDFLQRLFLRAQDPQAAIWIYRDVRVDDRSDLIAYPPLAPAALTAAEIALGFAFPPLLHALYTRIGNGHFGPGYGLLSLDTDALPSTYEAVVPAYLQQRQHDPKWPEQLLLICDWGCAIYSCVDCRQPHAPVLRYDPNILTKRKPITAALRPESPSLQQWLQDWLDDRLDF